MSKYLVRYNVKTLVSGEYQKSIIYNVKGDMSEEDVINFENKMSENEFGYPVTMISFDKLATDKHEEVKSESENKLAVFFLFDKEDEETVMCYTDANDVVSYTFTNGNCKITLKDDKGNQKTYSCPIPGVWFGNKDVLDIVPEGLRKQFDHPYLFNIEYKNYMRVK